MDPGDIEDDARARKAEELVQEYLQHKPRAVELSKYPPAKPGALDQEPLKAAVAASHEPVHRNSLSRLLPHVQSRNAPRSPPCFMCAVRVHLPVNAR